MDWTIDDLIRKLEEHRDLYGGYVKVRKRHKYGQTRKLNDVEMINENCGWVLQLR